MPFPNIAMAIMALASLATAMITDSPSDPPPSFHLHDHEKRQAFADSYKIFLRKRNAHACIMSIVFIVLFPLGAISLHLPLHPLIRRTVTRLHAPTQLLGLAMMVGAMGLGIDMARNDLHYIDPVQKHVAIGLLTTSTIIALQPVLGVLQHWHFRRTGRKSVFAYVHRWVGRGAIIVGWANSWLGFELVGWELIADHSLVRNGVIMGVLGAIWVGLVGVDGVRHHWLKKEKLGGLKVGWSKGLVLNRPVEGEGEMSKEGDEAGMTDRPSTSI